MVIIRYVIGLSDHYKSQIDRNYILTAYIKVDRSKLSSTVHQMSLQMKYEVSHAKSYINTTAYGANFRGTKLPFLPEF